MALSRGARAPGWAGLAAVVAVVLCVLGVPSGAAAAAWTITSVPNAQLSASKPAGFSGVSCASATMCIAVGNYFDQDTGAAVGALAEIWNGSSWSVQDTPDPGSASFNGISCPTTTECVAVGSSASNTNPLIEVWNGSTWSDRQSSAPPLGVGSLASVSCATATLCMAVGEQMANAYSDSAQAFTETYDGTGWTSQSVPGATPSSTSGAFTDVSCAPAGECAAISSYEMGNTLLANWNGTRWSVSTGAAAGTTYPSLDDVACSAATTCEAVGGTTAEAWNGTNWSPQSVPMPAGSDPSGTGLSQVSCTSTSACIAIGAASPGGKSPGLFTDTYDGTAWTLDALAAPEGVSAPNLAGLSCAAAITACVAVGGDTDATMRRGLKLRSRWGTTAPR